MIMAKQTINLGTSANDRTGTNLRAALDICNDNFSELYISKFTVITATELTEAAINTATGLTPVNASDMIFFDKTSKSIIISNQNDHWCYITLTTIT